MNEWQIMLEMEPFPTPPCKPCSACERMKAYTEYYLDKTGNPRSMCKVCSKEHALLNKKRKEEQ